MNKQLETFVPMRLKRRQSRLVNTETPAHDPGLLEHGSCRSSNVSNLPLAIA